MPAVINANPPQAAAFITISHRNDWIDEKHIPAFLGPLIIAILKRRSVEG